MTVSDMTSVLALVVSVSAVAEARRRGRRADQLGIRVLELEEDRAKPRLWIDPKPSSAPSGGGGPTSVSFDVGNLGGSPALEVYVRIRAETLGASAQSRDPVRVMPDAVATISVSSVPADLIRTGVELFAFAEGVVVEVRDEVTDTGERWLGRTRLSWVVGDPIDNPCWPPKRQT